MANRYWIAGSAANWNDTANWSTSSGGSGGASVPGSADVANFDGNGLGNCRLNASINVLGIVKASGYTGTIDAATDDLDHTIGTSGLNCSGNTGALHLGDGTWTCNGDWATRGGSLFPVVPGTGTVVWAGTPRSYQMASASALYNLTVQSGASYTGVWGVYVSNHLTVAGTLTANTNGLQINGDLTVTGTATGTATGSSVGNISGATCTISGTGTISLAAFRLGHSSNATATIRFGATAPVFTGTVNVGNTTWTQTTTVDNATNNPNLEFRGDVRIDPQSKGVTWTKGTGTITLGGSANQTVDFDAEAIEDLVIDKTAGTVTLADNFTTDSLTLTDGALAMAGFDVTVTGNVTVAAGFSVTDTVGSSLLTVGGNLDINGASGNTVVWNGPDLDVTGTADADWCEVTNSDASAGTAVTAINSTNNGGNVNWNFGAAGLAIPIAMYHYRHHMKSAC